MYCEFDKKCQETIKANRPDIPLISDIREYNSSDIINMVGSDIDLIIGGPPCQAFSTAGSRKSFDDDRGNVFLHFLNVATEISPKYIIMENVRGILSASYTRNETDEENLKKEARFFT